MIRGIKVFGLLCALLCLMPLKILPHPYARQFSEECKRAFVFYDEHIDAIRKMANSLGVDAEFLFAIAVPELTQFAYLRDKFETYSLKVLYVQGGTDYSNFSIGVFQMKPSFIQQMEDSLRMDEQLKLKFRHCLIDNPKTRKARVERVKRLEQLEWQINYLALFYALVEKQFANESFSDKQNKLRFYASAYNTGFHKPVEIIKQMSQKALFPRFSFQKYCYGDISVWFYDKLIASANK
ncbi:MAG: hypothetical protein LBL90_04595 [Prevotellaceae bacterium]|jgi:hypothetical protein|nr:hypothetical protein [Prevotellaceae bacterium]